jgi:hypothetical protein
VIRHDRKVDDWIMATRKVVEVDCDRCKGKNVKDSAQFTLHTGYEPDPAGGRAEKSGVYLDLCHDCMVQLLRDTFRRFTTQETEKFIESYGLKNLARW